MMKRRKRHYKAIFRHLRDVYGFNPVEAMSDFEKASRNAAREIWPLARIRGCNFHFCQAICRRARRMKRLQNELQHNGEARFILKMFQRLSLLPVDELRAGRRYIRQRIHDKGLERVFRRFWRYVILI